MLPSFLNNDIFKFWSETLSVSIPIWFEFSNDNQVQDRNIISTKIVITNFLKKLQKFSFEIFSKIHMLKNFCRVLKTSQFWIIKAESFKIENPDGLVVINIGDIIQLIFVCLPEAYFNFLKDEHFEFLTMKFIKSMSILKTMLRSQKSPILLKSWSLKH